MSREFKIYILSQEVFVTNVRQLESTLVFVLCCPAGLREDFDTFGGRSSFVHLGHNFISLALKSGVVRDQVCGHTSVFI